MKHIKNYAIFWVVLIILFNIVCFITPNEWYGISKFSGGFWAGYGFITASFVLHFVFSYFALSEKNKEKRILNTPLMIISYIELGLMIMIGVLCMVIPSLPYWIGIIVCYAVLAFSVIFLLSAKVVGEKASNANISLNVKTSSMRGLVDKTQELVVRCKNQEAKNALNKLYEAIRYSDPVTSEETQMDEMRISVGFEDLDIMVQDGADFKIIHNKVEDILLLIEKRNNKCKASKRQV